METTTIITIRDILSQIQENLDAYQQYHKDNNTDMDACSYGSENEYCVKSIIAGIKNILTDVGYLTRSHNLFLKLSTYSNRTEIQNRLRDLSSHLRNRQTSSIVSDTEWLKNHLRTYCLRLDRGRYLDFNTEIDELRRKAVMLEDEIKKTQQKLDEAKTSYSEIQSKQDEYNTIISELTSTKDAFIEEACKRLLTVSDYVVASSQYLVDIAKQYNANVEPIRNGTEFHHFHAAYQEKKTGNKRPIIGYYGAIAHWFEPLAMPLITPVAAIAVNITRSTSSLISPLSISAMHFAVFSVRTR